MVVLSNSILAKVGKMSYHDYKGYKWQCPTTQSPTQQHSEPKLKVLGWPSDPPPPGEGQGVGKDRGGGGKTRTMRDITVTTTCLMAIMPQATAGTDYILPLHLVADAGAPLAVPSTEVLLKYEVGVGDRLQKGGGVIQEGSNLGCTMQTHTAVNPQTEGAVKNAQVHDRALTPPVVTSDVTSLSNSSFVARAGSKPVYCVLVYCNVVLLGSVLIDECYNTHFSFVIFHYTKFGVTITQVVLKCVLGDLTSHYRGGRCRPPLSCCQVLQAP